jgi:hypothetical protein
MQRMNPLLMANNPTPIPSLLVNALTGGIIPLWKSVLITVKVEVCGAAA